MSFVKDNLTALLTKYKHREATRTDLLAVTRAYRSLDIKQDAFVFSNGTCMDLVNLQGTIPITYKSNIYNIPLCIWLMDTHPDNAPMCYVKPTSNMRIKSSDYVDPNGKVYCPYLHEWSPNNSNLLSLIQVLIVMFGETPPLYQIPTNSPHNIPYPTQPATHYMPMPTPYPTQPLKTTPHTVPSTSLSPLSLPYPTMSMYPPAPTAASNTGTISEQHIHMSLQSAAEDKVRRRLKELFAQTQAELQTLDRIQDELIQGKARLQHLLSKLEEKQTEWEKNLATLRDRDLELEQAMARIKTVNGELDIDEAVTTTAPLYNQLVQAFAEEAAAEDAIYYLGEALRRGVIDLDVFLKHVRALSRKQFMLRALMNKCRAKAGLPAA